MENPSMKREKPENGFTTIFSRAKARDYQGKKKSILNYKKLFITLCIEVDTYSNNKKRSHQLASIWENVEELQVTTSVNMH